MLDLEDPAASGDVVYVAAPATSARVEGDVGGAHSSAGRPKAFFVRGGPDRSRRWPPSSACSLRRMHGAGVPGVRRPRGRLQPVEDLDSSPMIERDATLQPEQLVVLRGVEAGEYAVKDASGRVVLRTLPPRLPSHPWSRQLPDPDPVFDAVVCPDGAAEVPLMAHDTFFPAHRESIGLGLRSARRQRASFPVLPARPPGRALPGNRRAILPLRSGRLDDRAGKHRCPGGVLTAGVQERSILRVQRRLRSVRPHLVPDAAVVCRHFLPGRPGRRGIVHRWTCSSSAEARYSRSCGITGA